MISQKFKNYERLKSRKKIRTLFESGKHFNHYPFRVVWLTEEQFNPDYLAQIAISVSKRKIKKAVERNHVKRKIREAYRKNKYLLLKELKEKKKSLFFMIIYIASENPDKLSFENEMVKTIQQFKKNIQKMNK